MPTLTASGEHSGLCSCLQCLVGVMGVTREGVKKSKGGTREGVCVRLSSVPNIRPSVSPVPSNTLSV